MQDNNESTEPMIIEQNLQDWVMTKVDDWGDYYEQNYAVKHQEYYRLWRGIWSASDKTRQAERSQIIAPALQQAVESNVAEIEEATFGRGKYFDIKDNLGDSDTDDIAFLRNKLHEDFEVAKVRRDISECLINSAVFGNGIGEVVLEEINEMKPATESVMGGAMEAVGVNITKRTIVRLRPILPQNFRIDPTAANIEEALGCAIDEFVGTHIVDQLQESGVYRDGYIGTANDDFNIEADQDLTVYRDDKTRLTKYYGLVPRHLLEAELEEDTLTDADKESYYIEACVVIANKGTILKAEASPYMMKDRPVVAFPWDVVPSRFYGRGVCEKGYNSQKALDAELRARIDALALTVHPMLAMDATRIPRGTKPEIRAGKLLLTNGDPREIINPFNFGNVSQITFAQAQALQSMVQQSTGAVDSSGVGGQINGEATAAGISMSLGAIIKRHKRTLINFQESFLIPLVSKAAYRYMQYAPDLYPVADYKFNATSTLGIVAREYEVSQLVQLLQTMGKDTPYYPVMLKSIVDNMNVSNREELMALIDKASQPTPEAQQAQEESRQADLAFQASQTAALNAQAEESTHRGHKLHAESLAVPKETEIARMKAITTNLQAGDKDDKEFERRMRVSEGMLKEREVQLKERVATQPPAPNVAENALMERLAPSGDEAAL
jgi:hypothetical protein|tara:strand:- start:2316 stop:4319 length:2004 start_codon:yes stop_codon:yes gene_type:complete